MFGVFLRGLGIDQELREAFGSLKSADSVYPMSAQLRMLLDMFVVGEHRVSYGCVVVEPAFYDGVVAPTLGRARGVGSVLPETRSLGEVFSASMAD